jgi:hypothetical protein
VVVDQEGLYSTGWKKKKKKQKKQKGVVMRR